MRPVAVQVEVRKERDRHRVVEANAAKAGGEVGDNRLGRRAVEVRQEAAAEEQAVAEPVARHIDGLAQTHRNEVADAHVVERCWHGAADELGQGAVEINGARAAVEGSVIRPVATEIHRVGPHEADAVVEPVAKHVDGAAERDTAHHQVADGNVPELV